MKIVVAGSTGLVGSAIKTSLQDENWEVIEINRSIIDLRNLEETRKFLEKVHPYAVVAEVLDVADRVACATCPIWGPGGG